MQEAALFMLLTAFMIYGITIVRVLFIHQNKETIKVLMNDWDSQRVYQHEPLKAKSTEHHTLLRGVSETTNKRL